eukprot:CAMPEP_0171187622 /NCGR_PEP_ID=MMETSP0790-20130122/17416_1 /TAXON_ID=2925 /ORGANISM="Alexandrium catenella, Strain OF101" /LENGTH=333 /DNA_ID=CAMNT_0011652689 /DNA_START=60 /DNA_END=1059 /DNA_ORIENTATION=-
MAAAALTATDVLVLAVHGVIAAVSLLGLWRSTMRNQPLRQAALALRAVRDAIRSWECAADDALAAEVEKRIRTDKVKHLQTLCQVTGVVSLPAAAFHVSMLAAGQECETYLQEVAEILLRGVCVATLYWPNLISWRNIDTVYAVMALCCMSEVAAPALVDTRPDGRHLPVILTRSAVMSAMFLVRRDMYVVAPTSALFALASCSALWVHRGCCLASPVLVMASQCMALLGIVVLSQMLDKRARAKVCRRLRLETAKQLLVTQPAVVPCEPRGAAEGPAVAGDVGQQSRAPSRPQVAIDSQRRTAQHGGAVSRSGDPPGTFPSAVPCARACDRL